MKTKTAKQKVEDNAKKAVKDNSVNESKPPTLSYKQVQVIGFLSKSAPYTMVSLCSLVNATNVVNDTMKNTFAKTVMTPLEKAGLIIPNKKDKPFTYLLNEKATSASHELPKLLASLPFTVPTSITVGFLGGMVFGKETPPNGKRDLWVNVRFGRATAAILKRLVACGAVGVHQQAPGKPKHYYRNPAK